MTSAEQIEQLIAPSVESLGYDLIRVRYSAGGRPVLQIMAERPDYTMTVEDCTKLSRAISAVLDVEDPIDGEYDLEVSSPGIDRPLVRLSDYDRFTGHEAKLETHDPIIQADGRRRFKGRIVGVEGESVQMNCDGAEVSLSFGNIASAKLVLTDELINASLGSG